MMIAVVTLKRLIRDPVKDGWEQIQGLVFRLKNLQRTLNMLYLQPLTGYKKVRGVQKV